MGKSHKQIVLVRSKYTKRAWLTDVTGKRLTPKFKIISKVNTGKFVILNTPKGVVIYHRHQQELLYNGLGSKMQIQAPCVSKIAENLYVIKIGHSDYRLYNGEGELLCDNVLENVILTSSGLIAVRKNSLWGFMDKDLNWILGPIFYTISEFNERGHAVVSVEQGAKIAVIDKCGNYVLEPLSYDAARFLTLDLLMVINHGKHGVLNLGGKVIVPVEYDTITIKHGYFIVQKDSKCGVIDMEGNIIFNCYCSSVVEMEDKFIVHVPEGTYELKFK